MTSLLSMQPRPAKRGLLQLVRFGREQALSCVFPVVIFASLALTKLIPLPWIPRYDWLLLICLAMQWWMVHAGLETRDEVKVITLFHLIGLALEIFKTHMGSWSYPEEGYFKVFGVPLYSGFMYASVASYLCQAWRRMNVELVKWPPFPVVVTLAAMIYLNFFTHHYWMDVRWWLSALVLLVFWRTRVIYEVGGTRYRMPLALSFALIGFFIWIAENIATFFGAWEYPDQAAAWQLVHLGKVSSWLLLVIVSFLIVATLKGVKGRQTGKLIYSRLHGDDDIEEMNAVSKEPEEHADDGLVTERDIDEEFGLFQEGSYPGALPDQDQQAAIRHALPDEGNGGHEDKD